MTGLHEPALRELEMEIGLSRVVPTEELAEFLAVVATCPDVTSATAAAAEQIAVALDAEVVAVLLDGAVSAGLGYPRGDLPVPLLQQVVDGECHELAVPGAGACSAAAAEVGMDGHVVVARSGGPLEPEETHLLSAMGRALALLLQMLRTLEAERRLRSRTEAQAAENRALLADVRDRQRTLEHLADVQRAIAQRLPLPYVLERITSGARTLLMAESVALVLDCSARRQAEHQLASYQLAGRQPGSYRPGEGGPDDDGHGPGDALAAWSGDEQRARVMVEEGAAPRRSMRFPVHEAGAVVGCLVAADWSRDEPYGDADRTVLLAYAEHASLALTDARTLETLTRAFHDPLTGLATRALFAERLSYALAGAARRDSPVSLLFLDLDRFKLVNDTLGHAAGDALLVGLAERLRGCLRSSDTAARFGGDEFVLLLDDTGEEGAAQVAEQVLEAVRGPFLLSGQQVFVDGSVGVAVARPGDALSSSSGVPDVRSHEVAAAADALLRSADVAMYRAKRGGKGRAEVFRPEMSAGLVERLDLEASLRRALERGELVLEYQPVVRLDDALVVGAEALLRWRHPRRGLIPPEEFVPVAEETGLIVPIGRWALREACAQAAQWRAAHPGRRVPVAVNLSARQLELPTVLEDVTDALAASGLPAELLCLELTETVLVRDLEPTAARLRELKELGVTLAVDDFGTGFSSLAQLWSFPVDSLKIDRSFVAGMASPQGAAFVRAIVGLARALDLVVVAEGIEQADQLEGLRGLRCQSGQGALWSWSLSAERFGELLHERGPLAS